MDVSTRVAGVNALTSTHFGKCILLSKSRDFSIGRGVGNDIILEDDRTVSRRHARITCREGKYVLEDMNSSNGTTINRRTVAVAQLYHGDLIVLGCTQILFLESDGSCMLLLFANRPGPLSTHETAAIPANVHPATVLME